MTRRGAALFALALAGCASPGASPDGGVSPGAVPGGVTALAFAPAGNPLVCGDTGGRLVASDAATGRTLWTAAVHAGGVCALAFSADGRLLATVGQDGTVALLDAADGATRWRVRLSSGAAYEYCGAAFPPDASVVAFAGLDSRVHLRAVADGSPVRSIETEGSTALLYTADGSRLLAGSWSSEVAIFDPSTGVQQANWVAPDAFRGAGSGVSTLALSADGALLAEGDEDGRVRLWETADGKLLSEIEGTGAAVIGIALSGPAPAATLTVVFADGTTRRGPAGGERRESDLGARAADLPVSAAAVHAASDRIAWGGWSGRIHVGR